MLPFSIYFVTFKDQEWRDKEKTKKIEVIQFFLEPNHWYGKLWLFSNSHLMS